MKTKMQKYQDGGSKKKTAKRKSSKSYSELTGAGDDPLQTKVSSPKGYSKDIEWQDYLADTKKPYQMTVTKGGKTNQFQLSKKQAINQRKIAKKEAGYSKGGATKMKTGGMVNPNAKMQASKTAGSKGVTPGVNPKAAASKVAKGRSGGTSVAPKTATPKAKYGMAVTKMKKK